LLVCELNAQYVQTREMIMKFTGLFDMAPSFENTPEFQDSAEQVCSFETMLLSIDESSSTLSI